MADTQLVDRLEVLERNNRWLKWWAIVSPVIVFVILLIIWYVAPPTVTKVFGGGEVKWDLWAVLIGLASLSLGVLTILIAFASVLAVVWGKPWLEQLVRSEAAKCSVDAEKELRGRLLGYVGFIFGRLRDFRPDLINEAIKYSELAHEVLPDGNPWKLISLNNLGFYYALRAYETDAPQVIKIADALLAAYGENKDLDYLTTYARIVAGYARHFDRPKKRLEDAERSMEEILHRGDATQAQKASASSHLERIKAALRGL